MKILITSLFLISSLFSIGQISLDWAKNMGGNGHDRPDKMVIDNAGNVFTTGNFSDTADFDPSAATFNLIASQNTETFICKLDSLGNFGWVKQVSGANVSSIALDADANVYTTGYFVGTVDFDPGAGVFNMTETGAGHDIFILKLDSTGNFIWAKSFPSASYGAGEDIAIDDSGNVVIGGYYIRDTDFDPGAGSFILTSSGIYDENIFVCKLTPNGDFLWAKHFGGNDEDWCRSITLDDIGNIYFTGNFENTADFDPGPSTFNLVGNNRRDICVVKLNPNGNLIWAKGVGGPEYDMGESISVSDQGNVYCSGSFEETVDFDPGIGVFSLTPNYTTYSSDGFVVKLDSSGNFIWAKSIGSSFQDWISSVKVDANENVFVFGAIQSGFYDVDLDPGLDSFYVSTNNRDVYLTKLDSAGDFVWAKLFGGSNNDYGDEVLIHNNSIYLSGQYIDTVDFAPNSDIHNVISNGGWDVMIAKFNPCSNTGSVDTHVACDSYTWLDGITYTTNDSTATYIIPNSSGCDSLIVLDLEIKNSVFSTDVVSTCDSIVWIDGNTYSSNNSSATFTYTATNGCDSVVSLDLTVVQIDTSVIQNVNELYSNEAGASYQWIDCDGNIVQGATNRSFFPLESGNYAVIINEGNCIDTSECVSIIIDNVYEDLSSSFSIYPNPTTGNINIEFQQEMSSLIITDELGRMVTSFYDVNKTISTELLPGIYFIEASSNNSQVIKKLMVVK